MKALTWFTACVVAASWISLPASSSVASSPRTFAKDTIRLTVRPVIVFSDKELMLLMDELDAAGLDFTARETSDGYIVVYVLWYGE